MKFNTNKSGFGFSIPQANANQQQQQQIKKAGTTLPFNQGAQQQAIAPPQPEQQIMENQPSADQMAAINWLGKQIRTVREWPGRDGRPYATVTTTDANPNNGHHNHPSDVARDLLKAGSTDRVYVTYKLRYNGNKSATARLISVDPQNRLIFALEVEYDVNSATGGITKFAARQQPVEEGAAEPVQPTNAGFGSIV